MADDLFTLGQRVMAAQPFSVLLGTELTRMEAGHVELALAVKPEFGQQVGYIHGGVLSYLVDNSLTFAGGSVLGADVLTAEFKLNYLRPGIGDRLIARAEVVMASARQAVCRCDVFAERAGEEHLCVTALGTIIKRP